MAVHRWAIPAPAPSSGCAVAPADSAAILAITALAVASLIMEPARRKAASLSLYMESAASTGAITHVLAGSLVRAVARVATAEACLAIVNLRIAIRYSALAIRLARALR